MSRARLAGRFALTAALTAFGAASARAEIGVGSNEILIGSCASLSGSNQFNGQQLVAGANAYFKELNAKGGVHGRNLRLLALDHKYNADEAIVCFKKLVSEGVFAAAFINGSAALAKMAPMAQAARLPMIGFYAGAEFLYQPVQRYIIPVKPSYQDEIRLAMDGLWTKRGARRIGVLYQADAAGASLLNGVRLAVKELGGAAAAVGAIDPDKDDGDDASIETVRAGKAEVVFMCGKYQRSAAIVQRSRKIGWKPLFVFCSATGAEEFVRKAGKAAEGVVIASAVPPFSRTDLPAVARYASSMKRYAPKLPLSLISLEGYVDAMVLAEGIKRAGKNPTREGFVDAIEMIHGFDMGLGPEFRLNYSAKSHRGLEKVQFTVVRNGAITSFSDWKTLK